jgi:SAM-dependent methyltransferase
MTTDQATRQATYQAIYQTYARVYDRSGQIAFALKMIPYLEEVLAHHAFIGDSAVDVACGTGTLALALAQKGWCVYGVDASSLMLDQARQKAAELGQPTAVTWVQADMRDFLLPQAVDLATSTYDSLNYLLTLDDLRCAFRCVAGALRPGGLFVFDMNAEAAFLRNWNDTVYFVEDEDLAIVIGSTYDAEARRATASITGFVRHDELYERFQETHTEQAYSRAEVAAALEAGGFEVAASYACFTFEPADDTSSRILWVARKTSRERA